MKVFFHDSTYIGNDEEWQFDLNGRTICRKLLPDKVDSLGSIETWTYNQNRLISSTMNIGVMSSKTNKLNTTLTKYSYDSSNNLVLVKETNSRDRDTLTITYEYADGLLIKSNQHNEHQNWLSSVDSFTYYPSKKIKERCFTGYDDGNANFKLVSYYDTLGLLQNEIAYNFDGKFAVPDRIKTFIYKDGKLIMIKETNTGTGRFSQIIHSREQIFTYNKKGLVIKCSRFYDGVLLNFDTFEYK
jgi:hypothetical protein